MNRSINAPMHICYLCDEYPPGPHGGIGSYTQTIARAMAARGHRVTSVGIYAVPSTEVDTDRGVRVVRVPHSRIPRTGLLVHGARLRRALQDIARESPIDLIEGPELSLALVPRRFPSLKIVRLNGGHHFFAVTLGKKPRPWRSWLETRSFRRADHFTAVSQFVAGVTGGLLPMGTQPVEVIPNPVDVSHFPMVTGPGEDGLIVFVGTLCEKKGLRQLVQGFPSILRVKPNARLLIVGRDTHIPNASGSYREMLRGILPAEQAARIEFTGHVERPDLPGILARAAVAVFPSHMESQGIVIIEAMASGRAVVTSRKGPGPEIIEDGVSGLLCDPHDPASIATHVIRALIDPDLRLRLGIAARARAEALFSEEALVSRTEAYYARVLAETRPA